MANDLQGARVRVGVAGLNGGGVTTGQLTAAVADRAPANAGYITRGSEAGLSAETSLGAVGTGLIKNTVTAGVGALSVAVGADLPAHNHTGVSAPVELILDGGGSAITSGIKYILYIPFGMGISGWIVDASSSSNLQITILRALAASPTSFTAISGTEKPTLASQQTNSDFALTTWTTTTLAAGDRLRVDVDASPVATSVLATLTLLLTRTI